MDFGGFDFSDLMRDAQAEAQRGKRSDGTAGSAGGGAFKDIFSQFFRGDSGGNQPDAVPEKGADLEYGLNITFWQAIQVYADQNRNQPATNSVPSAMELAVTRPGFYQLSAVFRHRQRISDGG